MTRRPTTYKASYEQELHRRQHLERRVEAMQQEIDALKWRLHVAQGDASDAAGLIAESQRLAAMQYAEYRRPYTIGPKEQYERGLWESIILRNRT